MATAPATPGDTTGNTIRYQIHRLCRFANTAYNGTSGGVANQCATMSSTGASGGAAGGSTQESTRITTTQRNDQNAQRLQTALDENRLLRQQLDRERLYREAQEAGRRKDRFLAMLAHELRSPLTAMLGEIDVTLKRPREAAEYRESLGVVRERIQQLAEPAQERLVGGQLVVGPGVDGVIAQRGGHRRGPSLPERPDSGRVAGLSGVASPATRRARPAPARRRRRSCLLWISPNSRWLGRR